MKTISGTGEETMTKRVRRALPLTLAVFLAIGTSAFGGDNAGAVISLDKVDVSGIGAGQTFTIAASATGMVAVRDVAITIQVSPVEAFNLTVGPEGITFTPSANFAALAALNPNGITVDPNDASLFNSLIIMVVFVCAVLKKNASFRFCLV